MNFLTQGISLGRWFGIKVVLSYVFLMYAAFQVFGNGGSHTDLPLQLIYIGLLFGTVLLHEFGHALACLAVKGRADLILLWPLGGLAFVQPPNTPKAQIITTACGPLVNAVLWPLFWWINKTIVIPSITDYETLNYFQMASFIMEDINKMLLLFNLIPAYPMDGGRLLQEILWAFIGYRNSIMIAGMVGTVAGIGLAILGMGLYSIYIPYLDFRLGGSININLVVIGVLCAMASFALYRRSQEIETWRKN